MIGYDKVGRTPSYTGLFSHPTLPIYHKILRPTLDCSAGRMAEQSSVG